MAGLIKRAGEEAAKRVGTTDPFAAVDLGSLGSIQVGPEGQPIVAQDPTTAGIRTDVQGLLSELGGSSRGGSESIRRSADVQADLGQGMLAAVQDFDPLNLAEQRFGRLQGILGRSREQQRQGLEERLFRQGRLDSTGVGQGNQLQTDLETGFAREDAALLDQLLSSAEQSRRAEIETGSSVAGEGARLQGGLMAQLMGGATTPQQVDAGLLSTLQASQGVGQAMTNQDIARAQAINQFNQVMMAKESGGGGIGSALGAVAGGAVGFMGGGGAAGALAGAKAGTMVGGGIENLF